MCFLYSLGQGVAWLIIISVLVLLDSLKKSLLLEGDNQVTTRGSLLLGSDLLRGGLPGKHCVLDSKVTADLRQ